MSDNGSTNQKGPAEFFNLPVRVLGMDWAVSLAFIPAMLFPFSKWSWIFAGLGILATLLARIVRLRGSQLVRWLVRRSAPRLLYPHQKQRDRDKLANRPWPY